MLVTFSTDAHADITLFGDIALTFIKMMGHSKTVPGAILAADVPKALERLKKAVDVEMAVPSAENTETENDEDEKDEPSVSLSHRALPLISLLAAAAEAERDVMWK